MPWNLSTLFSYMFTSEHFSLHSRLLLFFFFVVGKTELSLRLRNQTFLSIRNRQCLIGLHAQNVYSWQKSMIFCSFSNDHGHTIATMSHRNCHDHSSLFLYCSCEFKHWYSGAWPLYWTSLLNVIIF